MIKIIHDIVINESDDIKRLRIRSESPNPLRSIVLNTLILEGRFSNEFQKNYKILSNQKLKSGKYDIKRFLLNVGKISIEGYSIFPPSITIAVCDIEEFKFVEIESRLVIVAPVDSTEDQLVEFFKDKLTYFKISGGSPRPLGNIITFNLSDTVNKLDYDFYGNYIKHFNQAFIIDFGLVTKAMNDLVRKELPDYDVVPINNLSKTTKRDYVVYQFTNVENWRRPFVEELFRDTLMSQFDVQYEIVTFDTIKHQNILHHVRAYELLTNRGKLFVTDENGNTWKCAIDWGRIDHPFQTGSVKGNYAENAGHSFTITANIRHFSVPRNEEVYSVIKYIDKYLIVK